MVHFISIYTSISAPLSSNFSFFPTQLNVNMAQYEVAKELLMKIMATNHMSYNLVVCHRTLVFTAWPADMENSKEHLYLGHTAISITCTSLIL